MSLTASVPVSKEAEQNWPVWFQEQQASAWSDYETTPEPSRKDEAWRFSNIGALRLSDFEVAGPVTSEGRLINHSQGLANFSAKLVFGNNALLHQDVERLPEGVLVKSLEVAAREDEELFRKFFMAQPVELGSHKYAALHKARLSTGALLYVPRNVEVTSSGGDLSLGRRGEQLHFSTYARRLRREQQDYRHRPLQERRW